jgi:predicted SAM-dependent methyltransferase
MASTRTPGNSGDSGKGQSSMKLHLGCGKRYIPGFVHIDVVEYPHIEHVTSIDNLSCVADSSVDLIYNCHVLEHFKRREIGRVLREWRRILLPGGVLRISVPDFAKLVEVYARYQNIEQVIGPIFGRQDYLYNIHYNTFDFPSLKTALEEAGFSNVRRYDWRKTEHAQVDDYSQAYLPHMDKENGILISLNVECDKPAERA